MKLTYISHACLLIETEKSKVVTDPWFNGPAYLGQWNVFPKPLDTSFTKDATHLLLTHGHEDHFHIPTLKLMNKDIIIYYPYTWQSGQKEILKQLGFKKIVEVNSMQKIKISENFFATFIVNGLDAFLVYECEGKIIVNLNDALNSHHWSFVEMFCNKINQKWGKVDLLICGLGGAGYFPNCVHAEGKDDEEVAELREQFLVHKCLEIAEEMNPKQIFPFVPGFALIEDDKRWINFKRFPRGNLPKYYKNYFKKEAEFLNLMPGDYIKEDKWIKASSYHEQAINDSLAHLVTQQYSKEIKELNELPKVTSLIVDELSKKLEKILPISSSGISKDLLQQINFCIQFKDVEEPKYIHCYYKNKKLFSKVVHKMPLAANLIIQTYSFRLNYALHELWGGDVFYIGYGADIYVKDKSCLEDNIDIVSLRLLSRFPSASYHMTRNPYRGIKYLTTNFEFAKIAIKQKITMRGNMNKLPFNEREHWVNKSKCEICRLCDIPLLTDELGVMLNEKKPTYLP